MESNQRYDLAYTVQKEIDRLIQPAIERLKEKGRERDRKDEQYMRERDILEDEDDED